MAAAMLAALLIALTADTRRQTQSVRGVLCQDRAVVHLDSPQARRLCGTAGRQRRENLVDRVNALTEQVGTLAAIIADVQARRGPPGRAGRDGTDGDAGRQGTQGPPGPVGRRGPKGETGRRGPSGRAGDQGEPGAIVAAPVVGELERTVAALTQQISELNTQLSQLTGALCALPVSRRLLTELGLCGNAR